MQTALGILIVAAAIWGLIRGVDVRLMLFAAGLALATLAGQPGAILQVFAEQMGQASVVGPICTAMGYAFVLRATGSDQQMVRLLLAPIRRVRWLLVPGGCVVGFITNMAITSQTAAAASVGAVLVPLMLAAGFAPAIIAATLVLGTSGGGNLFNPGEPDIVAIHQSAYESTKEARVEQVLDAVLLPELCGFAAAVATLTLISRRGAGARQQPQATVEVAEAMPIDYRRALLPPLPVVLLFLSQPRWHLFPTLLQPYPEGLPVPHAMLTSTAVVLLVCRKGASASTKAFFEGMGFAFTQVISLIIVASCFIKGMELVGFVSALVGVIQTGGVAGQALTGLFPWMLAVLSGSGTAPSVSYSRAVVPQVAATDLSAAIELGVLAAIAATFGRTMSPVAAVVVYTAGQVKVTPFEIVRRTAPALAVGAIVVFAVVIAR